MAVGLPWASVAGDLMGEFWVGTLAQITELDSTKLLAAAGENSDRVAFTEYLKANLALHKYRTRLDLSTKAAASWIRSTVCDLCGVCWLSPACWYRRGFEAHANRVLCPAL